MSKSAMYLPIMEHIFFAKYVAGETELLFERDDIIRSAEKLGIKLPRNLGDVLYNARYRSGLSQSVLDTQPPGKEWVIQGRGRAKYAFCLVTVNRIVPNQQLLPTKVPDSTPEIVQMYSMTDEQALLAKVRYNRLIDIFLSCAAYSLQNHLRTTVQGVGQVEVDELYIAVNKHGAHYIIPVQAKGGSDQIGSVQVGQDIDLCAQKFPSLICRPIAAQFMRDDVIAMFEVALIGDELKIVQEQHYRLVPGREIEGEDLARYRIRSGE